MMQLEVSHSYKDKEIYLCIQFPNDLLEKNPSFGKIWRLLTKTLIMEELKTMTGYSETNTPVNRRIVGFD